MKALELEDGGRRASNVLVLSYMVCCTWGAVMGRGSHSSRSDWRNSGDTKGIAKQTNDEASSGRPSSMFSWPESLGAFSLVRNICGDRQPAEHRRPHITQNKTSIFALPWLTLNRVEEDGMSPPHNTEHPAHSKQHEAQSNQHPACSKQVLCAVCCVLCALRCVLCAVRCLRVMLNENPSNSYPFCVKFQLLTIFRYGRKMKLLSVNILWPWGPIAPK